MSIFDGKLSGDDLSFRLMADHAPVLLWVSGTDGYCTFFNQTWLRFTGRTLEQELGAGWAEGVHAEDFAECMDTYGDAFARRERFEMEYRLRRHDGVYRWVLDAGGPAFSDSGEFLGYIGSCTDISDSKAAQEAVQRDRSLASLGAVVVGVAHEVRNPLFGMSATLDALEASFDDRGARAPYLGALRREMERLGNLMQELLDYGAVRPRPSGLVDLQEAAAEALLACRPRAEAAGLLTLREPGPAAVVHGHRDDLVRAIAELLENAIDHAPLPGPVEVRVAVQAQAAECHVLDRGPGLSPEALASAFEPFYTRRRGGVGLGLSIARRIAEGHGGTVVLENREGGGAAATLRVPLPDAARS
jgi:PAS domain S-box-containing protein